MRVPELLVDGWFWAVRHKFRVPLARLSNLPYFYFDPARGEPNPALFVDNSSFDGSRIFGQGAALAMGPLLVSTQGPVCGQSLAGLPLVGPLLDTLTCDLAVTLGALR